MPRDTRQNVLDSARQLFARHGFDSVSVRQICAKAGVSDNAVHYHFGSKQSLYQTVLQQFTERQSATMNRILGDGPIDAIDLQIRLTIFVEEAIASLMEDAEGLRIAYMEMEKDLVEAGDTIATAFVEQSQTLKRFLESACESGLIRPQVDPAIVAGTLLERISYQVRYAEVFEKYWGESILDTSYRKHWISQTVDLCLNGISINPNERDIEKYHMKEEIAR
jgi:AcrR family transcriptional regulator